MINLFYMSLVFKLIWLIDYHKNKKVYLTYLIRYSVFFFFFLEFQPMTSIPSDSSLSLDQDTNQFLV